jgi:GDP-4-dehydro-6-deoxy-D-mannose reductase
VTAAKSSQHQGAFMRVLITGATGFVGTHLRKHLIRTTDWDIVGTAYPALPEHVAATPREHLLALDLRDREKTWELLETHQPDYVVHLAAQSHVPTAYQDPWGTLENNILGQLNLLEGCVTLDLSPRIIVIGSGEEYGRGTETEMPLTEDHPLRPENPYSVSKVTQDVMGFQYYISYDLPVIRVRPFNHVGPGQSPRFVLPAFASQIAEIEAGQREPVLHVGNLTPARDFTDVRDVVRAYQRILLQGHAGEVYNVASGNPTTIQHLLDHLLSLSEATIDVRKDPDRYRPADIPVIYGSADKLKRDTGWAPEIPIEQTIEDVLASWRERYR